MKIEKNFNFRVCKKNMHISYRKFCFEIGFFREKNLPLFSFKLFNLIKKIYMFEIFFIQIFNFIVNIHINY